MKTKLKKYYYDIKTSIDSIYEYLGENKDYYKYIKNKMLRRSVERELEIIAEAIKRILIIKPDVEISSKKKIISLRNKVIHNNDEIDNEIIWGVIIKHLPILKDEINDLLKD
jgi:uncharacterized protein with HEPN domain